MSAVTLDTPVWLIEDKEVEVFFTNTLALLKLTWTVAKEGLREEVGAGPEAEIWDLGWAGRSE